MITHIKVIGVLHIILGGLELLAGLAFFLFLGGLGAVISASGHQTPDSAAAAPVLGAIGAIIFWFFAVISLPGIVAGIGLLQFQPWAKILAIILSVVHLINIPIGTALGVYGLWALLSPESEALFRRPGSMVATTPL